MLARLFLAQPSPCGQTLLLAPIVMDGSEGEDVAASMRRMQGVFLWTYPGIGVLSFFYIGFGDAVFGIFHVVGKRLPTPLRSLMRHSYHTVEILVAGALHTSLFAACYTTDACTDKPLHRKWCMVAASVSVVAYVLVLVADRGIELLLMIPASYPGHGHGITARIFNAAAVCAVWICLGEAETTGVALLLAATARRALAPVPMVANAYMMLIKLYILVHTFWILHAPDTCHASSRRAPVAVVGTILGL